MFVPLMLVLCAVAILVVVALLVLLSLDEPAPPRPPYDPRMTDAEADPLNAIDYALDSLDAYGDTYHALSFLRMWREGDLSESQQYRDYVAAGGFAA